MLRLKILKIGKVPAHPQFLMTIRGRGVSYRFANLEAN